MAGLVVVSLVIFVVVMVVIARKRDAKMDAELNAQRAAGDEVEKRMRAHFTRNAVILQGVQEV